MKKCVAICAVVAVFPGLFHLSVAARPSEGAIVDVATVAQLQAAVASLTSGTTIRVAAGQYRLTQELRIGNGVTNVALVGATGNRADVVILGGGMATAGVNIAVKVENAQDVRIADLSIGETLWHPIQLKGESGTERVRVSNVRLFDAGQQFLKSTVNVQAPNGVDDVIVENSLVEYTNIGPADGYTEGIDVHHGARWIIRYNVFRNIRVPTTATYRSRPAILIWSGSRDSIVHGNTIINCERGIIFGQGGQSSYGHSHTGGQIYNNFIYRTDPVNADSGISLWDSPGTRVFHNTVIQNGTYPVAIEYRFASTTGVEIRNNLTDGSILQRDGATGVVSDNFTQATSSLFVNASAANLHLVSTATAAIDRGGSVSGAGTDIDGESRPNGAAPDLGADEFVGIAPPPPPPPPPASLAAPENLKAVVSGQSVQLSWTDRAASETAYLVERALDRRDGFSLLVQLPANATSYTDTGLIRGWHRYRVRVYDAVSNQYSPYSAIVEVRIK
jgi:hypothetical protein